MDVADAVVAAARAGDHDAFAAIVAHYDERLRVLAFQLLRDRDLMDDALQDVCANAYRALAAFRGESALGTWLFRITYTTCMGYLRRRRKEAGAVLAPWPDEGDPLDRLTAPGADPAERVASRTDLSSALATLPAGQAAALILVFREGLTYEETAAFDDHLKRAMPDEVAAPEHRDGFDERLWARIERERVEEGAPAAKSAVDMVWPRRLLTLVAAVAAALAIAALLASAPRPGLAEHRARQRGGAGARADQPEPRLSLQSARHDRRDVRSPHVRAISTGRRGRRQPALRGDLPPSVGQGASGLEGRARSGQEAGPGLGAAGR